MSFSATFLCIFNNLKVVSRLAGSVIGFSVSLHSFALFLHLGGKEVLSYKSSHVKVQIMKSLEVSFTAFVLHVCVAGYAPNRPNLGK